jgi:RNA polymerase sigma-70 factor (ECF subfamily)
VTSETRNTDEYILDLIQHEKKMDEGFRLLMHLNQEKIYGLVRRIVNNHEDADDIVQNTFIKAYKGIGKFERKSKISTWLYRIATNEALTFLNKNKKHRDTKEMIYESEKTKSDVFISEKEIVSLLESAINTLPDRQKMVFNMRYFDEMPYDEMSAILGLKIGGLKASFHHAVKKVESFIKENHTS